MVCVEVGQLHGTMYSGKKKKEIGFYKPSVILNINR